MASCIMFLILDSMFSYAGFVAIEVIAVSTIMTALTLIDAVVACRKVQPEKLA
jgi:hypothetical protein